MPILAESVGNIVLTPLVILSRLPDLFRSMSSGSLLEYTKVTRVEPIALIDHTISHLSETEDVCRTLTALFAGYYLQAIAISHNVGNIQTISTLAKLNPSRDLKDTAGVGFQMFGMENYQMALPRRKLKGNITKRPTLSFESAGDSDEEEYLTSVSGSGDSTRDIAAMAANLSTGIMLEVELESDGNRAVIPVSVRLIASPTPVSVLVQLCSFSFKNRTMKERWHGWRSGELSFIGDIVMCQDIIDANREALMKDDSGAYHEIVARKNKNKLSGLLSMSPSVATASNIMVISTETSREIEKEIGMRWSSFKNRQKIFKATYLMLVAIVDVRNQMVTIYHRDISLGTDVSFRELKRSNGKTGGNDVIEHLNSYMMGTNPTF